MNHLLSLSPAQLRRAADVKERIEELTRELALLLGSGSSAALKRGPGRPRKALAVELVELPKLKRRKMSALARAKIATAARDCWAKAKAAGKNSL